MKSSSDTMPAIEGCLLTKLASPVIRSPLPGLKVHPGGIELMQKHLTCCSGKGVTYDPRTDHVAFCSLTKRMGMVAQLAQESYGFEQQGEQSLLARAAATPIAPDLTQRFAEIKAGSSRLGKTISTREINEQAVVSLAMALAASWRFELRAQVVLLGNAASVDRFVLSLNEATERTPQIVVVAGVGRLFETQRLEQFEVVAGACFRGKVPLFACLEPFEAKAAEAPAKKGFKTQSIKNKIRNLQSQHPAAFFPPGLKKRLDEICQGLIPPASTAGRKPPQKKAPLSPEL